MEPRPGTAIRGGPRLLALALLLALAAACGARRSGDEVRARVTVAEALGDVGHDEGYARATEVRAFHFPADHGPHPDYRTEWWYFTGNLESENGRRFGYQLTFFRTAVAPPGAGETNGEQISESRRAGLGGGGTGGDTGGGTGGSAAVTTERPSDWRTRQIYMAHLALTDIDGKRFVADQRFDRGAAGLAGAQAAPFRVWVGSWQAATAGRPKDGSSRLPGSPPPDRNGAPPASSGSGCAHLPSLAERLTTSTEPATFPLCLTADNGRISIRLALGAGEGRVLQGDRGLSYKGPGAGNASYYYSYPRMPTAGTVSIDGETFRVDGASWLDREWSTSVLGAGQRGWDWFALQLDDGREVVAWRLRAAEEAGAAEGSGPLDYAALVPADPDAQDRNDTDPPRLRVLDLAGARVDVTRRWRSPASGVSYPAGWRLRLPAADLELDVQPLLADQELDLAIRYWEGAVAVRGRSGGRPVGGRGYVELTGYGDAAGRGR